MLKIAICDDEISHRAKIRQLINQAIFSRCEYTVVEYDDGHHIIEEIYDGKFQCDLLLLDIHMADIDGMNTADFIRKNQVDTDIIFVTISKEHVYEGYLYKAFSYMLKPIDSGRFTQEINRYLDEKERTQAYLNVNVRGAVNRIPIGKITYFESNTRKITAFLVDDEVEFYGKLDEIQESLGASQFIRCHQSYLINKAHVTAVSRSDVTVGDVTLPVSRKYQDSLKNIM